jgi:hypothetical protein
LTVSVGVLYAALDLLELLDKIPGLDQRFPDMFRTFSVADPKLTLDFGQRCGWVRFNVDGHLEFTPRGRALLGMKQTELALRCQLADVIESYCPPWGPLLSRGRVECLRYLPIDIQQCLKEAGLLGPVDDSVVLWWDSVAESSRKSISDARLKIGRIGEKLSLDYEKKRTGINPIWQSIESNLCGYGGRFPLAPVHRGQSLELDTRSGNVSSDQIRVGCGPELRKLRVPPVGS